MLHRHVSTVAQNGQIKKLALQRALRFKGPLNGRVR